MTSASRRLRIAQVAPPVERVPPAAYGGTERVVDELTRQLVDRGHDVTLFASGDSVTTGRLVPTVERALRPAGIESDAGGFFVKTVKMVIEQATEFDVIHSHLEWWTIPMARLMPIPTVSTFHGRLDLPWADRLFRDAPDGMVAISRHQASTHPDVPWTIIHNGLTLDRAPFIEEPGDAFCFVGRVDAEKGIIEAIDIALRAGRRLRIAAKVGNLPRQREYYESVFRPALQRAGRSVEFLGELQPAERDQLFAESYATVMPGAWPEPFGLVSIESLACGTPVLARRVGALPEIIREGVDGFFGDDALAMAFFADRLGSLDRREIRQRVIERFSAARMADRYEELYTRMIEAPEVAAGLAGRVPDAAEVEEALAVHLPSEVTEPADAELPQGEPMQSEEDLVAPDIVPLAGAEREPTVEAEIADAAAASLPADEVAVMEAVEGTVVEADEAAAGEAEGLAAGEAAGEAASAEAEAVPGDVEAVVGEAEAANIDVETVPADAEAVPATAEDWKPEVEQVVAAASEEVAIAEADERQTEARAGAIEVEAGATGVEPEAVEAEAVEAEPAEAEHVEAEAVEPGAGPGEDIAVAPPEELAGAFRAAVVDVVVAGTNGATPPPDAEAAVAEEEPAVAAEEAPVAVGVAVEQAGVDEPERALVIEEPAASGEPAMSSDEAHVAVPAASVEDAPPAPPARPPIAVGPGPSAAEEQATPTEPQKQPAIKPAPKRPTRSISIFTRSWSAGSGKKAVGSRRRDRS